MSLKLRNKEIKTIGINKPKIKNYTKKGITKNNNVTKMKNRKQKNKKQRLRINAQNIIITHINNYLNRRSS